MISSERSIQEFVTGFSTEVTPGSAAKISSFREHLREGTTVYITFLPGSDFQDTVKVAKRLREEGFEPVPHFAARSIANKKALNEYLSSVVGEAGVDHVLCIAGAVDKPVGQFTDSMQILNTGLFDQYGICQIAVAGHPEGSPDMTDESITAALNWKNAYFQTTDANLYLVTQFVFESDPVIKWDQRIQQEGNTLPIRIGIPGLATVKTLLMHAKACGIGPSMKYLTRQARNLSKLMTIKTPDVLVRDLAIHSASNQKSGIDGIHMYPLGGLRRSALWSYAILDGQFELNSKGGFNVKVDYN
ncbi:MAG: methylenetetrahydrofolate reductase [Gammaproteobacteria bacterium]|nr:methylenetetrahydrofolate reductase [Gammaproteobacteria bacterium]MCY4219607.1 methylenetetrahydrofolate reductase [Gammaproteobacteria bacterium]